MRHRFALLLLLTSLLGACWEPSDYDFQGDPAALAADEMLWVIRIPDDSLQTSAESAVFFGEYLPALQQRLLRGDIPVHSEFSLAGQTGSDRRLQDLLVSAGVPVAYAPEELCQTVQLYAVVRAHSAGMELRPLFLQLVWTDPESGLEVVTGGAYLKDLMSLRNGSEANVLPFLAGGRYHFLPVYVVSHDLEYQVPDARTAEYLRRQTAAGRWDQLRWVNDELNLSGLEPMALASDSLLKVSGLYRFFAADSTLSEEVFLSVEGDHLVADWSKRFRLEKVYPASASEFFTLSGDLYRFERLGTELRLMYAPHGGSTQTGNHVAF